MIALAALLLAGDPARVLALRVGTLDGHPALTVLTAGEMGEVAVKRVGNEVIVSLSAEAPRGLAAPAASGPLEAIAIDRSPEGVSVRVRVAPEVPYEVRRAGTLLSVLFGETPPDDLAPREGASDVESLYRRILPPPAPGESGGQAVGEAGSQAAAAQGAKTAEGERDGLALGLVTVRPSVSATYVDATTTVNQPQPVHDTYYQVQPQVSAEMPLGNGRLTGSYEGRFRYGSSYSVVRDRTQIVNAGLELPVGASVTLRGSERFMRGALETNEVDAGGEYFFNLGRFTRNTAGAGARIEAGGHADLDVGGSVDRVRFEQAAGFFSYDRQWVGASLGLEVGANLRAALTYGFERVPPPEARPEAESHANTFGLSLKGDILPLVTGEIGIGYEDRQSPEAASGGTEYRGLAASAQVKKEFSRGSSLALSGGRATRLSAFEENGFYVSSVVAAQLTFALPLSLSGQGSAGYDWNHYRTAAAALGVPRKDRIFGWSAGLGRAIGRWAYLRADYRKDRRTSNIDLFQTRTHALTVQIAAGLFGTKERAR